MIINSTEDALRIFRESAIQHGLSHKTHNYKLGNKHHDRVCECIYYLYNHNELHLLKSFLSDEDDGVRLWASFALLPTYTKESEKVMKTLIKTSSYLSFEVKVTLEEWRKGRLKFPWEWIPLKNKREDSK